MEPRHIFEDYQRCVLCISVELPHGEKRAGTGFHIGNGWIVTAKHVLEGNKLDAIVGCNGTVSALDTILATDRGVDLALIRTNFNLDHYMSHVTFHNDERRNRAKTDYVPLGFHLDDWVSDEFILSRVVLFGYPRVPMSASRDLVVVLGEVNAIVGKYDARNPHFIISPQPRSGFSGGPVFSEYGFLLGVLVESLEKDGEDADPGFAAVLSIEPLLVLLARNSIRPPNLDDEMWGLLTDRGDVFNFSGSDDNPKTSDTHN